MILNYQLNRAKFKHQVTSPTIYQERKNFSVVMTKIDQRYLNGKGRVARGNLEAFKVWTFTVHKMLMCLRSLLSKGKLWQRMQESNWITISLPKIIKIWYEYGIWFVNAGLKWETIILLSLIHISEICCLQLVGCFDMNWICW